MDWRKRVNDNLGLVKSTMLRYLPKWPYEPDELESIFREALCIAAIRFDETLGFQFSSYATKVMHNFYWKEMRIYYVRKVELHVLDIITGTDSEEEAFSRISPKHAPDSNFEFQDGEENIPQIKVSTRKKKLIIEIALLNPGWTNEQIAELAKCSKQYVGQVKREVRK